MDRTWSDSLSSRMRQKKGSSAGRSPSSTSASLPQISRRPNTSSGTGELQFSASAPELAGGRKATALQKGDSLRLSAFIDRQLSHPGIEARKAIAHLQRKITINSQAKDDVGFWGSKGIAGFRAYLRTKFGGIVAGWRELDIDKNGRLSFYEFCNACRKIGYHGNLKKLWRQLDANGKGYVSLTDIDAEVGHAVGTFKLALMKKYGDILSAWKNGLDVNGSGRIEEREIEVCLKNLGLNLDAKKLYSFLRSEHGLGLTLQDFDPDAYRRHITGDVKGLLLDANKEFIEDIPGLGRSISMPGDILAHPMTGGSRRFRKELALADKKEVEDAIAENTRLRLGLHTIDGFKSALVNRCGSLLGAWRESLDLDGNQRLTFGEFTQALQRLGFHGDVKGLWKQLDAQGMGYIVFGDLDRETDEALTELKSQLTKAYGNMLVAWLKAFDYQGVGLVDEPTFVEGCKSAGFEGKDGMSPKQLFRLMQPEAGRKFLTLQDFDIKAYNALHHGDFRMISEKEDPDPKKKTDMTFDERNDACFFNQIRRAWNAGKRPEFAEACRMSTAGTEFKGMSLVEGTFDQVLIKKYGSIISAWRNCLDANQTGKLVFKDFCEVVRWLGYTGDLNALWRSYDKTKKGYILLKDLDADADNHVESFLRLLLDRFGDLETAWREGFKKDPHDSIDKNDLRAACTAFGYPHDPNKLFKCLQPVPGKRLLTIWDLDPAAARNRAQGKDHAAAMDLVNENITKTVAGTKPGNKSGALILEEGVKSSDELEGATTSNAGNTQPSIPEASEAHKLLLLALKKKHGSTMAAWRCHFDPELTDKACWGKFIIVAQDSAYSGSFKSLWAELAGDKTTISFRDLDPDSANMLDEFRNWMVSSCNNIVKAWRTVIDSEGRVAIDEAEFSNKMVGKVKAPKKLFKLLLSRLGQRSIMLEDLEALLVSVPAKERKAIWDGSKDASPKHASSSASVKPGSPLSAGHSPQASDNRQHIKQQIEDFKKLDAVCDDLAGYKKLLKANNGSLFSGWRNELDVDRNGVVTFKDFARACQVRGVKAVPQIWAEFDTNSDGQISLFELDPECSQLFNPFEQLLIENYGSTKEGWREVFDKENILRCERDKFVRQCQVLGFQGDANRLFSLLKPEPGRNYLAYDDLWIDSNMNEFAVTKKLFANTTQGSPRSIQRMSPLNRTKSSRSAADSTNTMATP